MKLISFFLILFVTLFLISCSKNTSQKSVIQEKSLELQVLEAYEEGMKSLKKNDVLYAAKKFNEAELLFPQSSWAPKAALMAAYVYYADDYYFDAQFELNRFIKTYPKSPDLNYAHFLLAMCYYEQIVDEKKDLFSIIKS